MNAPSATRTGAPQGRPWTLTAGAVIALLEGAVLAALGLLQIAAGLVGKTRTGVGLTEYGGVILLLLGVLPLLAGRALLRVRRWGRSPAAMIDTLCLAVTWFGWENGGTWRVVGVLVGAVGIAGLVFLLHPRSTAALYG